MNSLGLVYKKLLGIYWWFRATFFSRKKPDGVCLILNESIDTIRVVLGKNNFTNRWEFSYRFRGEDLNMRRPMYKDNQYEWYQLHVRAWRTDRGLELYGHTELEPSEYPNLHMKELDLNEMEGKHMLKEILDEEEIEYEVGELSEL